MSHPSLRFMREISFSYCGLQHIPEWNHLKGLKFADVRGNNLQSIPCSHSLTYLDIAENDMTTLELKRTDFPKLTDVLAGSASIALH